MTHIQQRRDLSTTWTSVDPVLYEGEMGHETDTGRSKLGDGVTTWVDLPYKAGVDSVAGKTGIVTLVVADVGGAAPTVSPVFTGNPTAPTPATSDDDASVATTAFVQAQKDSPVFTGNPTAPTPATADNDTSVATTAFVKAQTPVILTDSVLTGNPTAPTPTLGDNDTSIATSAFVQAALARLPQGALGYAQVTANQVGTTAYVDLTGLSVAITPPAGRRIRITGDVLVHAGAAGTGIVLHIREGAATLQQRSLVTGSLGYAEALSASVILTPTAGAHTYKLGLSGTAAPTLQADAARPAFIIIEDLGPA